MADADPIAPPGHVRELRFVASASAGEVGAILLRPPEARWLLVLAHGAGAGMRHPFLQNMADLLAERGIASFRYQFPYMEQRSRRPDFQPILLATVRSAIGAATQAAGDLPVIAGGKSMGGRMTSLAAAQSALPGVQGIVFFGFPLHAAGAPASERSDHLFRVETPMLFLQGTRDKLANLELLEPICERLGGKATLRVLEGADHSFEVLKRSGRTHGDVLEEIARTVEDWTEKLDPLRSTTGRPG